VDFPDEIFYVINIDVCLFNSLATRQNFRLRNILFYRLMELNVIIPLMVHDRMIINCGLLVEQRVKPDY
jgi:hypothetical protein